MKKILLTLIATFLVLVPLGTVSAAEFRSDSDSLTIGKSETVKDLYTYGNNLIVNANVKGDLVTAGNTVNIVGDTEDSLFAAGGNVALRGNVTRHVRAAGTTVTLSGAVGGDVFIAGSSITISQDAVIGGDLFVAGDSVKVYGTVKGTARIGGNDVRLDGKLAATTVRARSLTIGSSAVMTNGLTYYSQNTADIDSAAKITGAVNYHKVQSEPMNHVVGLFSLVGLLTLIGCILLLLVLIKLAGRTIKEIIDQSLEKPLESLGLGFVGLIVVPIAAVILAITLIGIPFALMGAFIWLAILIAAMLVSQIFIGAWLVKIFTKKSELVVDYRAVLIGVIAYTIIGVIPVIGSLVKFLIFLGILGTIVAKSKKIKLN